MSEPRDAAIRPYDFRRPTRVTSRVRAELGDLHARLAGGLATAIGNQLGIGCEATPQDAMETASDALFETPFDPVFRLTPLHMPGQQILLHVETKLAQAFVDRILGGVGANREVRREATEIEASLLQLLAARLLDGLRRACPQGIPAGDSPTYVAAPERHAAAPQEGVVLACAVKTADAEGSLRLFLAHAVLAAMLGVDAAGNLPADAARARRLQCDDLDAVRVPVQVRWPARAIQLRQLAGLRVGDVIHLDHRVGEEIEILIGGRVAFRGHPGKVEESFGIQITRATGSIR